MEEKVFQQKSKGQFTVQELRQRLKVSTCELSTKHLKIRYPAIKLKQRSSLVLLGLVNISLQCKHACSVASVVSDSATLLTVAHQAPLSMEFSRQEYWSRLPFPPPGNLPHLGIEPMSPVSPALQANSLPLSHQGSSLLSLAEYKTVIFKAFLFSVLRGLPWSSGMLSE